MIKLSADRKVQGIVGEKNSFGIPAIVCCPQSTNICEYVCYADTGFFRMPAAKKIYEQNYKELKFLLKASVDGTAKLFTEEILKHNKSGLFRWNIGGDLFSQDYWQMIKMVAALTPKITHWIYTRSFDIIMEDYRTWAGRLDQIDNLKLLLSFDAENYKGFCRNESPIKSTPNSSLVSMLSFGKYLHKVTWLGASLDEVKDKFSGFGMQWITCPVDTGKLPLDQGCSKCRLCFKDPVNTHIGIFFPLKVRGENRLCKATQMIQIKEKNLPNSLLIP